MYRIEQVFEKGIKRYYVFTGEISQAGPFIWKKSARKFVMIKKMNMRVMMLLKKHPGMTEEIEERIFEALEETIDRVSE